MMLGLLGSPHTRDHPGPGAVRALGRSMTP